MIKNVYLFLVYAIYSLHMFSLSLRMQKNLFKYITPISSKLNLTKIRKIKLFRKEKHGKQVNVFNDVVNKYIGLDLFFKKLNNVTNNEEKLNYINFLHKIVQDKTCEHLLLSNNYMRIIIYILNEKFLKLTKNEEKTENVDYQLIYKLLLIFKNLTKYKKFYHVILSDYTHKNVKISLLYIIMNILNEKRNNEKYKEASSIFNYFTSFFKYSDDSGNKNITEDTSNVDEKKKKNKNENQNESKNQNENQNENQKGDIDDIRNKIYHVGKNILLKLKEEKIKVENKTNEKQWNCQKEGMVRDWQEVKKASTSNNNYENGKDIANEGKQTKQNEQNKKDVNNHHYENNDNKRNADLNSYNRGDIVRDSNIMKQKSETQSWNSSNGIILNPKKNIDETDNNTDNILIDIKRNKKYINNERKEVDYKTVSGDHEKGRNNSKVDDSDTQNYKELEEQKKNANRSSEINSINEITNSEEGSVLFLPFYFNKNSKDNILTSIIVNFQNKEDIIVYKKITKGRMSENGTDRVKKRNNVFDYIGNEYNCNNYYEIYDNYAEDDQDILKYEKNKNRKKLQLREQKEEEKENDGNRNTIDETNEEGEEEEKEEDDEGEVEDEQENNEEDSKTDEKDKVEYENKYDENNVNIVFNDYDINVKDMENKTDTKINVSSENKSKYINMGLLILVRKKINTTEEHIILNKQNNQINEEMSNSNAGSITDSNKKGEWDKSSTINLPSLGKHNLFNYLNIYKYINNLDLKFSLFKRNENKSKAIEGYEDIYIKYDNTKEKKNMESYVLIGIMNFNMDLIKNFKAQSENVVNDTTNNSVGKNGNSINITNPYINLTLLKNYVESLFVYLNLNDYFTNKVLKLLYEILIENKNSVIYNLYYYTIIKEENMKKIIEILSKNIRNNLHKANTTLILRILYILCFQQSFYINVIEKNVKEKDNYLLLYKNLSKYIEDIKMGNFIRELQKNEELIECLKLLTLFFENKYKKQNSFYISDEKKEQFLYDNKVVRKKLNNIYNRHFICEYKDLIIIRKTNIILKSLGVNMFDLYNDIIFTDREHKTHEYLMKENDIKRNIITYFTDNVIRYFVKLKKYIIPKSVMLLNKEQAKESNTYPSERNQQYGEVKQHVDNQRKEDLTYQEKMSMKGKTDVRIEQTKNNSSTVQEKMSDPPSSTAYPSDEISSGGSAITSSTEAATTGATTANSANCTYHADEEKKRREKKYFYNLNNKEYISFDKFRNIVIALKKKKKRKLRILCLDGGGIRGLLSIEILKCINSHLKKNLFEYFDIICGTSTGAVISILIGLEKAHLNEIEFLYNILINKIFQKDTYAVRNTRYLLKHSYYDSHILNDLLNSFFKNIRMFHYNSDFFTPYVFTVSTQMNITPLQPVILKNYNVNLRKIGNYQEGDKINYDSVQEGKGSKNEDNEAYEYLNNDVGSGEGSNNSRSTIQINENISSVSIYKCFYNIFVKYVLRCTTAAPGFFNFFSFDNNIYADGALCFNNPTLLSLNEMKLIFYNYLNKKKTSIFDKMKNCFLKNEKVKEKEKEKAINLNDYIDCIVSVGTGKFKPKIINELNDNKTYDTFLRWDVLLKQIVYSITNTELTHDICNNLLDKNKYFRFNCFINNIKLDETSPEIIMKLKHIGKRYFEDHKYNQEKLINLINILEEKDDIKEYHQNQKRVWKPSYISLFKSKISNLIFPNEQTFDHRDSPPIPNLKTMQGNDSAISKSSAAINATTTICSNNKISPDQRKDDTNSITHGSSTNMTMNMINKEGKANPNSVPYRNFNFKLTDDGDKFDLNDIEEILDIINKNNSSIKNTNTSNGFFNYFTNLFYYNNNKFLKKLENMHNSLFIRMKREKNNYVNVIPNTGIRVLLNEIYYILLKKNIYFHTDEHDSLADLNQKDYNINIDKIIPYDRVNSKESNLNGQEKNGQIQNEKKLDSQNIGEQKFVEDERATKNVSKDMNNSNTDEYYSSESRLYGADANKDNTKGAPSTRSNDSGNSSNSGTNNSKHMATCEGYKNTEGRDPCNSVQHPLDTANKEVLNEENSLTNIVDNPHINKKRNFKNVMSSCNMNYEFFKSLNIESSDVKKNNIIQVLRNFFFKKDI
ncbi:patatin-like phospholipase, putative [Plasmodium malariae]|uniref:Patatin-like phospholipase, putative n=1 Tax=Plasmodium malariae TaxID=5858 RepID=A0A1C3KZC3_PLAMA|nr:patatin-like phospholipase, putative [Plasmodium malariae]